MPLFKIEVPVTFNRVYYVEAASSYDAFQAYLTGNNNGGAIYNGLELDVDNENFIDFKGEDEIPEKATVSLVKE